MLILNLEKSKAVFEYCKGRLARKECYNNIFNVVTDYISKLRSCEWRVAYGYVTVFNDVLCRHCFIVDDEGQVIDPTIIMTSNTDRKYYVMKAFEDVDDYFAAIEEANYMPALNYYLQEESKTAYEWALENNKMLIE